MSDKDYLDKLKQDLKDVSKPAPIDVEKAIDNSLNPDFVEAQRLAGGTEKTTVNPQTLQDATAPDRAGATSIPAQASPVKMAGHRLSIGYLGEEMRENFIQNKGELSVSDKLGFNKTNQGGIDGASISLDEHGDLILYLDDNKAYASDKPVYSASALEKNLQQNIEKLKSQWQQQANDTSLPDQIKELAQLAYDLAERGLYQLRITNGGGHSQRTTIPDAEHLDVNPHGNDETTRIAADQTATEPLSGDGHAPESAPTPIPPATQESATVQTPGMPPPLPPADPLPADVLPAGAEPPVPPAATPESLPSGPSDARPPAPPSSTPVVPAEARPAGAPPPAPPVPPGALPASAPPSAPSGPPPSAMPPPPPFSPTSPTSPGAPVSPTAPTSLPGTHHFQGGFHP
jgi:hypothetical protein